VRTILGVILITAATIATASAQSFSMDHGHAADAAKAVRAASAAAAAKAAAIAAGTPLTPSQSTDFSVNGSTTIRAAPPRTPEEQKADAEAQAAWQARCRPTVMEDREGIRRTRYAEPNCDLSRFNTAGAQ
jgi:CCR4-NOT transcriptional regulation complex NOT5 subunit